MKYPRIWIAVHGGPRKVADNPKTPVSILELLSEDKGWIIRRAVARNLTTPTDILRRLSQDEVWLVRWGVAGNLNTPADILRRLSRGLQDDVWEAARENLTERGLVP